MEPGTQSNIALIDGHERGGARSLVNELRLPLLRVLLINADDRYEAMVRSFLMSGMVGRFELERSASVDGGRERLLANRHDVCLLRHDEGTEVLGLLAEATATCCDVPVLLIDGGADYRVDIAAMERGVAQYLVEADLSAPLLERTIRYAIRDRRLQQELRRRAFSDSLTGLSNRRTFMDRLEHALLRCRRSARRLASLLVDLDDFKPINDEFGHGAGDDALKQIAARLRGTARAMDTVARIGGDEFAFLLEDLQESHQAARVADEIIAVLRRPLRVGGQRRRVNASIGIATYPDDIAERASVALESETLLSRADVALYRAKRLGGGRAVFCVTEAPGPRSCPAFR